MQNQKIEADQNHRGKWLWAAVIGGQIIPFIVSAIMAMIGQPFLPAEMTPWTWVITLGLMTFWMMGFVFLHIYCNTIAKIDRPVT